MGEVFARDLRSLHVAAWKGAAAAVAHGIRMRSRDIEEVLRWRSGRPPYFARDTQLLASITCVRQGLSLSLLT